MLNVLVSILAFVVALGLLVTFHELGHFWVARWLNVKVLRFSFGFGRVIYQKTSRAGVEYCISAVPLGGYVKMLDEREGNVAQEDLPYAFNRQSVYKRILIVLAGPMANFLLAIVLFSAVFRTGMEGVAPIIGEITPDSYAQRSGLHLQDEVIAVNDIATPTLQSVRREVIKNVDHDRITLDINRDGETQVIILRLPELSKEDISDVFANIGMDFSLPPLLGKIAPDTPAQRAGLMLGDIIMAVDDLNAPTWDEMVEYVSARPNTPMHFVIKRGNELFDVDITSSEKEDNIGFIGVFLSTDLLRKEQLPLGESIKQATLQVHHYSVLTLKMIYYMVIGKVSWENVSGPVTIAHAAGATAQIGWVYFLDFLAIISISLGVINLLPIPLLDGGHLLYYVIEIIRRKPVSEKVQFLGLKIGFLIIMSLMAVALYNDFIRLLS